MIHERERAHLRRWLAIERSTYADVKWERTQANAAAKAEAMRREGYGPYWIGFVENYLKRAELLGLQTPQGRQAMGKAVVTLNACLEAAIEVFGPMPRPGRPSGEIQPWTHEVEEQDG